ncbi:glycosyltransferase family 4 protein [Novacetimonas hansenii]|uniref:Glycosyltransferase family 4 protein n=1 Tax=Novacetimonas hansenii TaxID=436 RepID=A0AAW5ETG7_NOVHA|nr:glycosyltransferase family 4 protein [Novacetimonas hansenii]MBL7235835.1 glycosyltransferase family 4 protein [Novacetimonas hansenii]MCJ8355127.1 glycosyltransferase family 4 protein [Novacetimonas hansenii]RFP00820.1 hexosyltransferase [Novacetimonas hansenii]WEQ57701.1 glycosyltransferase family 4 protein [Novacetimonas hansenii]CUW46392.1 GDP-mannose-dependent alpha-(1-2)-phosphatidylinositol mannosyltransferase [Novacetimonas hansenii]
MRVVTVLPRREGYSPDAVGAIGLQVTAMAGTDDVVVGMPITGTPLSGGRFVPAVMGWWPPGTALWRYACAVARAIRRTIPAPDLIEVHNRPDMALFLARRFPGVPILLVLHNDPQGMRFARTPAQRRALVGRVRIAAVSHWLRARFLDGLPDDCGARVVFSPNGTAVPATCTPAAAREAVVMFAGRVVADKGADLFVQAWASIRAAHPGWRAVMYGADRFFAQAPETPFIAALRPQAKAAGVKMLGYRPHADVLAAMGRAAIVVMPGRWPEPFGLSALEAMAAGAALVSAPYGALSRVVGDGGLLVPPMPVEGLAAALSGLMGAPAARAALSARGREQARRFDLPHARAIRHEVRAACIGAGV